ncbi:MAG: endonuclease III [Rhodospirillaceae bacterium]|nr:endonuclease III [Rhodospirillaceae bacterium]
MKKADIEKFFSRLREIEPHPKSDLNWTNPFTLLVAVVLSAQSTDVGVNKATKKLFKKIDSPEKMIKLGEAGLKQHIKTIGLYNTKAKNVIKLSQMLVNEHDGQVPRSREDLQKLPGVGRKTANVVLNVCWGEPTMAVDTHIFRVSNRTGLAPGKNVVEVENKLLKNVPDEFMVHAHHWLILHGRYTCKARKPMCVECTLRDICSFKNKEV